MPIPSDPSALGDVLACLSPAFASRCAPVCRAWRLVARSPQALKGGPLVLHVRAGRGDNGLLALLRQGCFMQLRDVDCSIWEAPSDVVATPKEFAPWFLEFLVALPRIFHMTLRHPLTGSQYAYNVATLFLGVVSSRLASLAFVSAGFFGDGASSLAQHSIERLSFLDCSFTFDSFVEALVSDRLIEVEMRNCLLFKL